MPRKYVHFVSPFRRDLNLNDQGTFLRKQFTGCLKIQSTCVKSLIRLFLFLVITK